MNTVEQAIAALAAANRDVVAAEQTLQQNQEGLTAAQARQAAAKAALDEAVAASVREQSEPAQG